MGFRDLFGSAADKDEEGKKPDSFVSTDNGYDTPLGVGATAAEDIQRLMQAQRAKTKSAGL